MPLFRSVIEATAAVAAGAAAAIATVAAGTVVLPVAAVGAAAGAAVGLAGKLAGGATGIAVAKYLDQPNGAQINNPSSSSSGSSSSTSSSSPTNNDPDNMSVQYTRVAVEGATAGGAKTRFFNELDERGFTGAHSAIELDDAESLKSALEQLTPAERVMNLSKQNKRGHSCFHRSAICKSVKTLEVMIERIPRDELCAVLAIKDNTGSTCLHWAAHHRFEEGLKHMLSAITPEERTELTHLKNEFGDVSTSRKHQPEGVIKVIEVLLQSLEPPQAFNLVCASNNQGKTVIHIFAEENTVYGIERILRFFDVENRIRIVSVRDETGQLAVHIAAENDRKVALLYMLESFSMGTIETVLSERDNQGMTPLHLAPHVPPMLALKLLVDQLRWTRREIHVISIKNAQGKTPIHLAAQRNDVAALQYMLESLRPHEKVAVLELKDNTERSALDYAYRIKNLETIACICNMVTGNTVISIRKESNHWSEYLLHREPTVLMFYMATGRSDAEEELLRLKTSFSSINMPPSVYRNPNRLGVLNAIRDSRQQQSGLSALIVVTMSHGDGSSLLLRNGQKIAVQDIIDEMDNMPPGTPKVLIIQACIGQDEQHFTETDAAPVPDMSSMLQKRFQLKGSDFLLICSCVHDSVSYRNVFIPYLAEQLNKSQEKDDLYDLFLDVSSLMKIRYTLTPESNSTMTKGLQLKNKLWHLGTSF